MVANSPAKLVSKESTRVRLPAYPSMRPRVWGSEQRVPVSACVRVCACVSEGAFMSLREAACV